MTKRTKKSDTNAQQEAVKHSKAFIALVDLARHMARCAAERNYESMLEASKDKEKLLKAWEAEQ